MTENAPTIVLFRRDLRLADHPALDAAIGRKAPVILVYIQEKDDPEAGALGAAQKWWLHHSLTALGKDIAHLGNRLILLSGSQNEIVEKLVGDTSAGAVYWNRRYHKRGRDSDAALKTLLKEKGVDAQSFAANLLHEPSKLLTGAGGPYRVYTPFWKAFSAAEHLPEPLPAPHRMQAPQSYPKGEELADWRLLPVAPDWAAGFHDHWTPGEAGAKDALEDFLNDGMKGYRDGRDRPASRHTSRLSPHLALGEISPLQIWHAVGAAEGKLPKDDTLHFRKELVWREFSWHLLFHFPDLADKEFNKRFAGFDWDYDAKAFRQWTKGKTGYPIVDAGMRQLWQTGWMHNRIRMVAASFLIKDLMIDWRHGERWFRDTLVDADPASNAASWQWVAGCGADAAPYFRIFNPILQGEKFDGKGGYVREFVPELGGLPDKYIQRPFEAPRDVLEKAKVALDKDYPKPIVDHAHARDLALSAYRRTGDES